MHAQYQFLISLDDMPATDSDEEFYTVAAEHIQTEFDTSMANRLDENNWHSLIYAVLPDGRVINFDLTPDETAGLPVQADRWAWARRTAAECVAMDMALLGSSSFIFPNEHQQAAEHRLEQLSIEELIAVMYDEVPKRIAWHYTDLTPLRANGSWWTHADGTRPKPGESMPADALIDTHMQAWERGKLVAQFEAALEASLFPFTKKHVTPYDYRAFDLTDYPHDGQAVDPDGRARLAILVVDIHT